MPHHFSKSAEFRARYPDVAFGLVRVIGAENPEHPPGFDQHKRKLLRRMKKPPVLAGIEERVEIYNRFFSEFDYPCPLPLHLKRTKNSGFPRYNLMVDAHFLAEMCAGILVAVADDDRFDGGLTLDLASADESWQGMGPRELTTKAGEIVLRDERDIVCVLCQGADEKTRVGPDTTNVLFYGYGIPGVEAEHIAYGLSIAAEAVIGFGGGRIEGPEIH